MWYENNMWFCVVEQSMICFADTIIICCMQEGNLKFVLEVNKNSDIFPIQV